MTDNQPDELGEKLVALGLVPNLFVLDLNQSLSLPDITLAAPWNLPSRLFRFPIEVSEPVDGVRRIGLLHPLLAGHPGVQQVERLLGITLQPDGAPNAWGVSKAANGQWWHAVDLVTAGLWRELVETRRFTTEEDIARAVSYGLCYSAPDASGAYLSTRDARQIMRAIDAAEPFDISPTVQGFAAPQICRSEQGRAHWPINSGSQQSAAANAWGYIFGIEQGWFGYDRSGFLGWTEAGRARYAAAGSATYTETTGQGAFAF